MVSIATKGEVEKLRGVASWGERYANARRHWKEGFSCGGVRVVIGVWRSFGASTMQGYCAVLLLWWFYGLSGFLVLRLQGFTVSKLDALRLKSLTGFY